MAATFTSVCSIASTSQAVDKKLINSSETLSSFTAISSSSLGGRKKNTVLKKRYDFKIQAATKKLHFNQDGDAIRKLQVSLIGNSNSFILDGHPILLSTPLILVIPWPSYSGRC